MLRSEQIPGEQFNPGDRVRAMILDVKDMGSQVKIYLSRAHPDFIRRLFEVEVPEVLERTIEIKAMAREAGYRTKMAVASIGTPLVSKILSPGTAPAGVMSLFLSTSPMRVALKIGRSIP